MSGDLLPLGERLYYRDELRAARAAAMADAEGFQQLLFAYERMGMALSGEIRDLNGYKGVLSRAASPSSLSEAIPSESPQWHSAFSSLFEYVREARNDALHQGAFARTLTSHAIQMALVLEDALMDDTTTVSDFMVRTLSVAFLWQPASFVRQQMLSNGYSYMPIRITSASGLEWRLVSESELAKYLRSSPGSPERKGRLSTTMAEAVSIGGLKLTDARTCIPTTTVSEAISMMTAAPLLVLDQEREDIILGIVSPSDLL